jgi:hypothetical protein
VKGGAIYVGVDGHNLNTHFVTGAYDAHGNLATIRDENLLEHEAPEGVQPSIELDIVMDSRS